jgi:hypothetical protein
MLELEVSIHNLFFDLLLDRYRLNHCNLSHVQILSELQVIALSSFFRWLNPIDRANTQILLLTK